MTSVLSVVDVVKHFGPVRAVDGVSFEVRKGTITGLLGRNGAGKTTTIRMVTGVLHPDRGSIRMLGGKTAEEARESVGYLPEERGLYKQMKLLEQLLFLAEVRGRDPGSVRKAAERWLSRFELWDKRDAKLEELSKGNQQKVQLIGALLHDPELVLLDEPMSGLDPVNVILVRDLLAELKGEGKTILLSTHMMGEAERSVDEIVLIHGGKVVLSGDLAEVKGRGGRESVHLQFDGDGAFLSTMPGVAKASVNTNAAELTLSPDADLRALLREAAERLAVRRFEVAAPTLEELFVEAVGGETLARSREGAGAGSPEVLS